MSKGVSSIKTQNQIIQRPTCLNELSNKIKDHKIINIRINIISTTIFNVDYDLKEIKRIKSKIEKIEKKGEKGEKQRRAKKCLIIAVSIANIALWIFLLISCAAMIITIPVLPDLYKVFCEYSVKSLKLHYSELDKDVALKNKKEKLSKYSKRLNTNKQKFEKDANDIKEIINYLTPDSIKVNNKNYLINLLKIKLKENKELSEKSGKYIRACP